MPMPKRPARTLLAFAAATTVFVPLAAASAAVPGDDLSQLIAIARAMNPEIRAMALEADAAAARADQAGALDDPKFKTEIGLSRAGSGYLPSGDTGSELYQIRQMFPLWGKRDLKREIAEYDGAKARALKADAENQLAYRIKTAYAEYHAAHLGADETRALIGTLKRMTDVARARYAQGPGKQQDVTGAEAERGGLVANLARMDADRRRVQIRINGLLARSADTPLAAKPQPRPIPPIKSLVVETLIDRARADLPSIRAQQAQLASADKARELADRNGLPDVELGLGVMRTKGRFDGYQAMVEFNVPLYASRRNAERRAAASMASAAEAKLEQLGLEVETDLRSEVATLEALGDRKQVVDKTTLPQARIAFDAAVHGYELGRGEFADILLAQQTLRRALLEEVNVTFEQQIRLAEIERLVGGDL